MMNTEEQKEQKKRLRQYADGVYTRGEAEELLGKMKSREGEQLWAESMEEVWQEASEQNLTTGAEKERYKKEAILLLRRIEHRKRFLFQRALITVSSIAAAILLIWGAVGYLNRLDMEQVNYLVAATGFGERKEVQLPDGSTLMLNACSSVRYPDRFVKSTREVVLHGEAYFRVARREEQPFVVKMNNFSVRVLGTRFDVKAYRGDELASVCVESGKVQVDLPEAMMRLTANEQLLINTRLDEYNKRKDERQVAVWRKGSLRFSSTPIQDVAKELERVYNCRITFEGGDYGNLISGEHDNQSLESVLQSVSFVSGLHHRQQGRNVVFYK